jgi:hypothetical protein
MVCLDDEPLSRVGRLQTPVQSAQDSLGHYVS